MKLLTSLLALSILLMASIIAINALNWKPEYIALVVALGNMVFKEMRWWTKKLLSKNIII